MITAGEASDRFELLGLEQLFFQALFLGGGEFALRHLRAKALVGLLSS
ncbi:MAG TPA: hypothetical protein VKE70_08035 [Candidatus Solibacter sp.]|nr:hypothetical protein [Candidatus Solibacter sp.]